MMHFCWGTLLQQSNINLLHLALSFQQQSRFSVLSRLLEISEAICLQILLLRRLFAWLNYGKTKLVSVEQHYFKASFRKRLPTKQSYYNWYKNLETKQCLRQDTNPVVPFSIWGRIWTCNSGGTLIATVSCW